MAFTWTAPKGQGLIILKDVLQEMRDNADYIDDNPPACMTNNVPNYVSEFITDLTGEYSIDNPAAFSYNYNSNYSPRCGPQVGAAP